ncbi:MAG: response regulator [Acidobacteria bacterium]|nr:response regulator [Acidobacteriota bacterium]
MESETLQNFIKEAEIYIPMIRNGILVCTQEGNVGGELETSLRYTQSIKHAALRVGFEEISGSGEKLEQELKTIIAAAAPLSAEQSRNLLDNIAQLEALLAKLQFSGDDFPINLDGFVEQSFHNLGFDSAPRGRHEFADETDEADEPAGDDLEGFEIDEEMLEIFAMEADDLLRNINTHLEVLKSAPDNRESLLDIRRNAHTLKGSAGIVGLKPLSNLAHRVEDLLDYLSEKEIAGNRKIFELLQTSSDCLSALASGENTPQLNKRIKSVYRNFDKTFKALESGTFQKVEKAPAPAAAEAEPETADPMKIDSQSLAVGHKPVVRVSLEKLDELVRLVGDLVISRSVFEQRLAEFERQIGELHHSTGRLTRSTNKLETDFEASMLSGSGIGFSPTSIRSPQSFDALEFDRYTDFHQTTRELLETAGDTGAITTELDKIQSNLEILFGNQSRLIEEMHDKLLRLRMVKFGSLAARLHRTVRVTCEEERKQAELIIEGEQTEVDTQILDLLVEPLLHLLRNAVAHGIESPDTRRLLGKPEKGRIFLRLHSEGTHIILTVSDDGRGISAVALREKAVRNGFISQDEANVMSEEDAFSLSFLPGVTTAETISQTAGRGVGMNIIKTSVQRGQGTIAIASEPQQGATFTIRMPMALAITRGLLVKTNWQTFAFPLKLIKKVHEIPVEEFNAAADQKSVYIDGAAYTIANLGELLQLPCAPMKKDYVSLLLLETLEAPCALMVDEIIRAEEIVIKPLAAPLQNYPNLLGATILGDGNVVPVLDLIYLLKSHIAPPKPVVREPKPAEPAAPETAEPPAPATAELRDSVPEIIEAPVTEFAPDPIPAAAFETTPEMVSEPAAPEEPAEDAPAMPRVLNVMIVDDSPSVRHITSKLIKNAGWQVVLAKDGLEALETLQSAETLPDIVLTDVEMPRMDGYELLASVKNNANLQNLPVIMITSRASEKHQQKAVELGVSEYMTKPFDDTFLLDRIKHYSNY